MIRGTSESAQHYSSEALTFFQEGSLFGRKRLDDDDDDVSGPAALLMGFPDLGKCENRPFATTDPRAAEFEFAHHEWGWLNIFQNDFRAFLKGANQNCLFNVAERFVCDRRCRKMA